MGFQTPDQKQNWNLVIVILSLGSFQSICFTLFQKENNTRDGDASDKVPSPTQRW